MHMCEFVYLLLSVICWEDKENQHDPHWAGWDLDYGLLYLWEGLFYRLKGDSGGYGALHTNQFTQISRGQGGGILISHCFLPDQHTPSQVKGPPAVYNFPELHKPLDHREIPLLCVLGLQATVYGQSDNKEIEKPIFLKFLGVIKIL